MQLTPKRDNPKKIKAFLWSIVTGNIGLERKIRHFIDKTHLGFVSLIAKKKSQITFQVPPTIFYPFSVKSNTNLWSNKSLGWRENLNFLPTLSTSRVNSRRWDGMFKKATVRYSLSSSQTNYYVGTRIFHDLPYF